MEWERYYGGGKDAEEEKGTFDEKMCNAGRRRRSLGGANQRVTEDTLTKTP